MRSLLRFPPIAFIAGVGTWLLLTAACTTVRPIEPIDLSPPRPPVRVWVTRGDHVVAVFDSARVIGDSLIGLVDGKPERIPLSAATAIRARQLKGDRTAALVWGWTTAMAVLVIRFMDGPSRGPVYCETRCD